MPDSVAKAVGSAEVKGDLRTSPRRRFPYMQKAAPMVGDKMPSPDQFTAIRCKDLSGGGIAVVLDKPPDFEHLVFALGIPPAVNHVTARVVRTQRVKRNGRTRYVVGCQFVGRLQV